MSMLFEQPDPTERFRERREAARRRRRRHKAALALLALGAVAALALGAQRFQSGGLTAPAAKQGRPPQAQKWAVPKPRLLPSEVRGVHVTIALASRCAASDSRMGMRLSFGRPFALKSASMLP